MYTAPELHSLQAVVSQVLTPPTQEVDPQSPRQLSALTYAPLSIVSSSSLAPAIVTPQQQTQTPPLILPPNFALPPPLACKTDTPLFFEGMLFHYIDPSDFEAQNVDSGTSATGPTIVEV